MGAGGKVEDLRFWWVPRGFPGPRGFQVGSLMKGVFGGVDGLFSSEVEGEGSSFLPAEKKSAMLRVLRPGGTAIPVFDAYFKFFTWLFLAGIMKSGRWM